MQEYFVSNFGDDMDPGTFAQPFRTISHGVSVLLPGDILSLRGEVFVEKVEIADKHGTPTDPIVIRSRPGEHAYIDGSFGGLDDTVPQRFRTLNNDHWELALTANPPVPGAHPDEYVSKQPLLPGLNFVNRGAFLDSDFDSYTRLITYSNIHDLRAENQTFEEIPLTQPDPLRPGFTTVMERCRPADPSPPCQSFPDPDTSNIKRYKPATFQYPWVYMGPGIWSEPTGGRVHIRLSPTSNHIAGLADYSGAVDPRQVELAIIDRDSTTLYVYDSDNLRFENLSIRFGGDKSVILQKVNNIDFDHVRIWATTIGVSMEHRHPTGEVISDVTFRHCKFNGGVPTWFFREDKKHGYAYIDGSGHLVHDNLGKNTVDKLLVGDPKDLRTQIYNCEFFNGHDLYLVGKDLTFHHNWINNMNDDGLFVDEFGANERMKIYQNVILKTISAISFSSDNPNATHGSWFIYRNLIDLREPTAGYRPRYPGDTNVWRYGDIIKSNPPVGPYALFQNTFLVYARGADGLHTSFIHYGEADGPILSRRSYNNMFIAVNPDPEFDKAITYLPTPNFDAQTDGNNYFRIGFQTHKPYRHLGYTYNSNSVLAQFFTCLDAMTCTDSLRPNSHLFTDSGLAHPLPLQPYEAHSIECDPQLCRIGGAGLFSDNDDLRLGDTSPAIRAGVNLPDDLQELVQALDPCAPSGSPDIGCYPFGSGPLKVGVDGLRRYPSD